MKWSVSRGRGPSPVRTELVEVLVQSAPALRQAQRERVMRGAPARVLALVEDKA